jgi:shikimate kinase
LRTFAGCGQSTVDQKFIETEFQLLPALERCRSRVVAAGGCATKVPAPAPVQSVEAFWDESLTRVVASFSTEFSTLMLKTSHHRSGIDYQSCSQ